MDASLATHLAGCPACTGELESLRAMAEAAASLSRREVPEPPEEYWEMFLPRLRARLDARPGAPVDSHPVPASKRARLIIVAASLVMIVTATVALLPPRPPEPDLADELEARLESAIAKMAHVDRWQMADAALETPWTWNLDDAPGSSAPPAPAELLEALNEVQLRPGGMDCWTTDWIDDRLEPLSREQAEALGAQLARDAT